MQKIIARLCLAALTLLFGAPILVVCFAHSPRVRCVVVVARCRCVGSIQRILPTHPV